MLEASVLTIADNGEPVVPYYNAATFNNYVNNYLEDNISKYTKEYTVTTKYFKDDGTTLCISNCHKVSINLKAKINTFYNYDKTQTFVVRSSQDE